ncbi:MAG TPA: Na+/H+ antiporter subunit E [Devosia sp.]|nr:Na+/H+ antiporter subunit E [Devosia sp.]
MKILSLAFLFLRELIVSAIRVSILALTPRLKLHPAIVSYPLSVSSDAEITVLANLITLTPGTLSINVSDDRKTLLIHCIDAESGEAAIDDISGGFETKVLEVFR